MNMNKVIVEDLCLPYRKGCDHEFVVALETLVKVVPWKFDIESCVVVGLRL